MLNFFKGWFGEKAATFGLWVHLDDSVYHRVHYLIVPAPDGTTQLDHGIVSRGTRLGGNHNKPLAQLRCVKAMTVDSATGSQNPCRRVQGRFHLHAVHVASRGIELLRPGYRYGELLVLPRSLPDGG